jgi:hypothetical protein
MEAEEVKRLLDIALQRVNSEDPFLLENDLYECCIGGRLAMYLQALFSQYSVDVEYSKHGILDKTLSNLENCANKKDEEGNSVVRPDIAIHCRGNDTHNLLVLELKKRYDSVCNRERIRAFREQYGYTFGATIICTIGQTGKIRLSKWFDNARPNGI